MHKTTMTNTFEAQPSSVGGAPESCPKGQGSLEAILNGLVWISAAWDHA